MCIFLSVLLLCVLCAQCIIVTVFLFERMFVCCVNVLILGCECSVSALSAFVYICVYLFVCVRFVCFL